MHEFYFLFYTFHLFVLKKFSDLFKQLRISQALKVKHCFVDNKLKSKKNCKT